MLRLIRKTRASGVIFLSGDVHYGELSLLQRPEDLIVDDLEDLSSSSEPPMYPLWDLTSSGLTQADDWPTIPSNMNRIGSPVNRNHAGLVTLRGDGQDTAVDMELFLTDGTTALNFSIPLRNITFYTDHR